MSQKPEIKSKDLVKCFFGDEPLPDGMSWKCKCGKIRKQDITLGYTNLKNHIEKSHGNYKELYADYLKNVEMAEKTDATPERNTQQQQLNMFFDDKSNNIFKWLLWIVEGELTLNFPEKPHSRSFSNLDIVSTKTLKKYGFAIEREIVNTIISKIAEVPHVALVFDGWTAGSTHFIGVFASLPAPNKDSLPRLYLLRFSPLLDGTSYTAAAHRIYLMETMEYYKIPDSKVFCIVGDNCNTNKALADSMNKPLIGCRSHRFNLGMESYLKQDLSAEMQGVHLLMTKLKTLKGAGQLKRLTGLKAKTRNVTRWSSSITVIEQYVKIKPLLVNMDEEIQELAPTSRQAKSITEHLPLLENLNKVTLALQSKDMTLGKSHAIFQQVISNVPNFDFEKYLSITADIVHAKDLESALIKIQGANESYLTEEEKEAVITLKKVATANEDNDGMY